MPAAKPKMKQIIIEGYRQGLPIREIAHMAGTTYESCRTMAHRLGLIHPNRGRRGKIANPPWHYPAPEHVSPQYANWLRAKEGAAKTLKEIQ